MDENVHPRRYAKACDACHRKKIKCVFKEDICELCEKTGQQCKFTRIEKAAPKRPQRGKYLVALESRLKNMEKLLQKSRERPEEQVEEQQSEQPTLNDGHLATIISRSEGPQPKRSDDRRELRLPVKYQAMHLVQGYFACFNHTFPIFAKTLFMHRMGEEYPPEKHKDLVWWSAVVTVLCYAHRLRAMSTPLQAEKENEEASRYLKEVLDIAPKLTYGKPSIGSAQVLLGLASILRGTAMPDPAPMLVSAAIRMLQHFDVHKDEPPEMKPCVRKERERVFWVAYILDKDNALQTQKPPVLHEQDIGRPFLADREEDGVGTIRSLDSYLEVNLFAASQRLASIQGKVWNRIHSAAAAGNRAALQAAQRDLNPVLVAWKNELPFEFKREGLAGHWPKHAIVHIVVLHFRYFQTLVELNRVPPLDNDEPNPLKGDCPIAKSLPSYPHSTAPVAVEAARDALDLASLTPRGNFQNVWLFFHFSISAVLTLCVNGIVRPLADQHHAAEDLRRVDAWIGVIDLLATSSERADLLEKKEFLLHMRTWTLHVLESATSGQDSTLQDLPCLQRVNDDLRPELSPQYQIQPGEQTSDSLLIPDVRQVMTPDIFPIGMLHAGDWGEKNQAAQAFINWPY